MLAHHGRVLAPVPVVHVLQHALALAVREVDVDVGWLGALLAEEALEQQLELDGIDRRDPQAVADGAVGRRTASLAQDPLAPSEAHDVPHHQEVPGEPELADERQFVLDLLVVPRRAPPSPPFLGPSLDESREVFVLGDAGRQREARQARLEVLQPERAAFGDHQCLRQPRLVLLPAAAQLRVSLQVELAVGAQPRTHAVERLAVTQCAQHIVRQAPGGPRVVHVVGHHPRHVHGARERDEFAR